MRRTGIVRYFLSRWLRSRPGSTSRKKTQAMWGSTVTRKWFMRRELTIQFSILVISPKTFSWSHKITMPPSGHSKNSMVIEQLITKIQDLSNRNWFLRLPIFRILNTVHSVSGKTNLTRSQREEVVNKELMNLRLTWATEMIITKRKNMKESNSILRVRPSIRMIIRYILSPTGTHRLQNLWTRVKLTHISFSRRNNNHRFSKIRPTIRVMLLWIAKSWIWTMSREIARPKKIICFQILDFLERLLRALWSNQKDSAEKTQIFFQWAKIS